MDTLVQVHLATQYLAMAGKSFLDTKPDDSHTNVGFFIEDHTLRTWPLNSSGSYLAFDFKNFSLKWVKGHSTERLFLNTCTHQEVLKWLEKTSTAFGLRTAYNYDLHYDLPYTLSDDFKFKLQDKEELNQLLLLRILAQHVLKSFLTSEKMESDIRIWPHHFDTGAFVVLNHNTEKSVGMGMAIPDSVIDQHYFYLSGYNGHEALDTSNFSSLTKGEWKSNGFKGATLKASNTTKEEAVQFFKEAFSQYQIV